MHHTAHSDNTEKATQAVFAELQAEFIKVETEKKRLEADSRQHVVSTIMIWMQFACTSRLFSSRLGAAIHSRRRPPAPSPHPRAIHPSARMVAIMHGSLTHGSKGSQGISSSPRLQIFLFVASFKWPLMHYYKQRGIKADIQEDTRAPLVPSFSPDHEIMRIVSTDAMLLSGIHPAKDHQCDVYSCAIAHHSSLVASGDSKHAVYVSSPPGGRKSILSGHSGVVTSLDFSPSDELLLSSSSDKSIIIWKLKNGEIFVCGFTSDFKRLMRT